MVDGWIEESRLWKDGPWMVDGSWMKKNSVKGGRWNGDWINGWLVGER